jgi:predicted HicB family RNase H-like nuclease
MAGGTPMNRTPREAVFYATVMVRMPEEVHKRVAAQAAKERRSMNSQILVVLEKWLASLEEKQYTAPIGAD